MISIPINIASWLNKSWELKRGIIIKEFVWISSKYNSPNNQYTSKKLNPYFKSLPEIYKKRSDLDLD